MMQLFVTMVEYQHLGAGIQGNAKFIFILHWIYHFTCYYQSISLWYRYIQFLAYIYLILPPEGYVCLVVKRVSPWPYQTFIQTVLVQQSSIQKVMINMATTLLLARGTKLLVFGSCTKYEFIFSGSFIFVSCVDIHLL